MPRKARNIEIEYISGSKQNNLQSARSTALPLFINDLSFSMRRLLTDGWRLIQENGTANIQQGVNRLPITALAGRKTQ